jgi:hypothetical protein
MLHQTRPGHSSNTVCAVAVRINTEIVTICCWFDTAAHNCVTSAGSSHDQWVKEFLFALLPNQILSSPFHSPPARFYEPLSFPYRASSIRYIKCFQQMRLVLYLYSIYLLSPYMFRAFLGPSSGVSQAVVMLPFGSCNVC